MPASTAASANHGVDVSAPEPQRLDLARWVPAISMLLVSLISYIDRTTLALLAPTILQEMQLSAEQYGFIVSAFSVAYMIGNPFWGQLLDRFGLRRGMGAAVFGWTVASIAHVFTSGFAGLAMARAALGFAEGATFPGGLRTVVQTLPPENRSRGIAIAYSGGSLGAIITPLVVTPIIVWYGGWRAGFWFTGVIGFAWLVWWWFVSRRPDIKRRYQADTSGSSATNILSTDDHTPLARLRFSDRRVWSFIAAYAFGALPLGFIVNLAAIYLHQALGKSQVQIGAVVWIPPLGWEVGYFVWGWLTDRGLRRAQANGARPLAAYRRLMLAALILSMPLALTPSIGSYPVVMFELFFAMFVAAGFVILAVSYATSTYSASHSGLIAGLGAGSWSALVAIAMPIAGRLLDQHRYDTAFTLATVFPIIGVAAWWILSRE